METTHWVSVALIYPMVQTVVQQGVSMNQIFEGTTCGTDILNSIDHLLSIQDYDTLIGNCVDLSGDPYFGLHQGVASSPGNLGLLGHILMNGKTIEDAIQTYIAYHKILCNLIEYHFQVQESTLVLSVNIGDTAFKNESHLIDSILASSLVILRSLTGAYILPESVNFKANRVTNREAYTQIFQTTVHFKAPENSITYNKAILQRPILFSNQQLLPIFINHAEEILAKIQAGKELSKKVSDLILKNFRGSIPKIESIASQLVMSVRNLQLKLKEEGTGYAILLKEIREKTAKSYLQNKMISISEIAHILGFSEPSVFHKTFKKWTGSTPGKFRNSSVHL